MAGEILVLVWPENGGSHGITRNLREMIRKNHIKIFFKVGAKIAKKKGPFCFLANFYKFQIHVQQSFFVLHKRLPYGKTSIFYEAYAQIKIKGFA